MANQGLWGAIDQYWTVDEKPRLHRRNTYLDDHQVSNWTSFRLGIVACSVSITLVILAMLGGIV